MTAGLRLLLVGLGRTEHAVEAALAATALDPAPRRVAVPAAEGLTPLTEATSWPAPDAVLLHGPSLVDGDLRRAVINHLHAAWPEAPVLVVHGGAAASFAASAMEEGAADVVPAFGGHLAAAILLRSRQAMDDGLRRRAEQETRSGHERFRRILDEVAKGREAAALIAAGAIDGLSIGYRTVKATKDDKGRRLLNELELWEVSLVTFPMLPVARVAAKAAAPGLIGTFAQGIEAARRALKG